MGERTIRCRLISITLLLFTLTTLLSGCGSKSSSSINQPPAKRSAQAKLPDGKGGTYKTGNPYMIAGRWYTPMKSAHHYDQKGVASWYGDDFHGKLTANGERYDMYSLSAAHKTLPLPTLVRVTNLENGKSVVVRVNDRGPFVKNRLIDLSYAAANALGYLDQGTTRVRVQTLDQKITDTATITAPVVTEPQPVKPSRNSEQSSGIFVQLGAYSVEANAEKMRQSLIKSYPTVQLHPKQVADKTLYRVRIGPFESMKKVEDSLSSLKQSGYPQAVVIIE